MARATKQRGVEEKLREILEASPGAALDSRVLEGATRAELLQIGRALGLRGMSRLRKAELVERIRQAFRAEESQQAQSEAATERAPGVQEESAGPSERDASATSTTAEPGWSRVDLRARKFSVDERSRSSSPSAPGVPLPEHIPWGYGRTRVGALPVDPDRLFVYWEVTDEAIEEARQALGPAGKEAWLDLRVYDTTGRLFDGNNAHSYFDQGVDKGTRQWFFDIEKPGSEAFVEIGLRSPDGRFRKLARSGRVAFARRMPAPYREPQWLTVSSGGELSRAPVASSSASRTPGQPRTEPGRHADDGGNVFERLTPSTEVVDRTIELSEERIWTTEWESEPFSVPVDAPAPVWETYGGEARTFQVDGRTHVVFGPWQVVVRGIGARGGRRVLSRWVIYRSWAVEGTGELQSTGVWRRMLGSSALLGGSERRFRAASELRLSGASELLYRGASERRLGGASERVYAAASERLMRGASERRIGGASERRFGGASERWPPPTRSTASDE